jgi:hypothetical protein
MGFKKGESGNKNGRPKGSQNKTGLIVKEILEAGFEGIGGLPALIAWAKKNDENRGEFYKMFAKLLPRDVNVKTSHTPESEPIPESNRWLSEIATAAAADAVKKPLPH